MLGEDLDPELLKALQASQKEYEEQKKKEKKESGDKLIADIMLLGEVLQIPSPVLDNLTKNFNQYCQECLSSDSLKKVDFHRLIEALYDLSATNLDKVRAHLLHDLQTSVSYVNQFNTILNLSTSSKELFKDLIARPLEDVKPTVNRSEEEAEEDEELKKAIALSLASEPKLEPETTVLPVAAVACVSSSSSSSPSKETINLTRQLRFILQIPGTEVEACLLALQAQKHWDNSLHALDAYAQSTKEYSSKGLIAFMQEGPTEKAAVTPNTPHEIEKKPSNRDEKKRRFK